MKITYDQLDNHLQKNLAPVYCLHGEELLLLQDSITAIRNTAIQQGYNERKKFFVETAFDWKNFLCEANSLSLFSDKTFLELHFAETKLNENARKALEVYCETPPPNKILLIIFNKLDKKEFTTNWHKNLEKNGVSITIYPLSGIKLTKWIVAQLQQAGFNSSGESVQMLVDLTEGNLLATRQAIEKLKLYYTKKEITQSDIAAIITDSSHFDIFDFTDALLIGNINRVHHIYEHIKSEGIEMSILLWAVLREIRLLIQLCEMQQQGQTLDYAFTRYGIWDTKKNLYRAALKRHSIKSLYVLIQKGFEVDQMIKGALRGNLEMQMLELIRELM